MIKYAKIIGLSVIIGVIYFASPDGMIKDLSYAAPPSGGGGPTSLSPIRGEGRETDKKRTPPDPGMMYLPIDLGDKRCRMAKTADGFAGYLDIDGDDVEEDVRIAKKEDGILLSGSFGRHVLEFDYNRELTPRTALLDDGRGGKTIFDFTGSIRIPGEKGEAEFMIIHSGLLALLDKQRIGILAKNGIDASSLEPGDPGISAFADHQDFRKSPDHKAFTALSKKHEEVRRNQAEIIKILGEKAYGKFEKNYFLYKTLAERNADYITTISRHFNGDSLDKLY